MAAGPDVRKLLYDYQGDIRLVIKHLPYEPREHSRLAAEAALAAWEQGKYWEMHDKLIENSPFLDRENLLKIAREIGLDLEPFKQALDTMKHRELIERDRQLASELGVFGTPTFFVNGRKVVGHPPYPSFAKIIEEELESARQ